MARPCGRRWEHRTGPEPDPDDRQRRAHWRRRAELPGEVALLLGEDEPVSYGELQEEVGRQLFGEEWPAHVIPAPVAQAGAWLQAHLPGEGDPFIKPWMIARADDHYALDCSRARQLLDWRPVRTLRETLPRMIARLREDPRRWYEANELEPPQDVE